MEHSLNYFSYQSVKSAEKTSKNFIFDQIFCHYRENLLNLLLVFPVFASERGQPIAH